MEIPHRSLVTIPFLHQLLNFMCRYVLNSSALVACALDPVSLRIKHRTRAQCAFHRPSFPAPWFAVRRSLHQCKSNQCGQRRSKLTKLTLLVFNITSKQSKYEGFAWQYQYYRGHSSEALETSEWNTWDWIFQSRIKDWSRISISQFWIQFCDVSTLIPSQWVVLQFWLWLV